MGNHDLNNAKWYLQFFEKVMAIRVLDQWIMTHIPIHPGSLGRFKGNIHGHIHRTPTHDGPYVNVSVEAINYTPIALEAIKL
jgi:calcineurin-like phosphoesterase family protein